MHSELLKDLVVIFAVAVVMVLVLRRLHVPAIAGFIASGIVVGPNVLRIVADVHEVEVLAEVGVALLLFGIGVEMSLKRVRRLWRLVVPGGSHQDRHPGDQRSEDEVPRLHRATSVPMSRQQSTGG